MCFRLDKVCAGNGSKTRLNKKHEVVTVFTFNSSFTSGNSLKCHLELYIPSSSYGFSVFIEEMALSGSTLSGCSEDYLQFGRDILFVTTHLSKKYCGEVELPIPRSKIGMVRFEFPFTPWLGGFIMRRRTRRWTSGSISTPGTWRRTYTSP
jgi:hypothetical protein